MASHPKICIKKGVGWFSKFKKVTGWHPAPSRLTSSTDCIKIIKSLIFTWLFSIDTLKFLRVLSQISKIL